jgi:hypothetical protein
MMNKRRLLLAAALAVALPLLGGGNADGNGGSTGNGRRANGPFPNLNGGPDVSALKSQLAATDEEWTVICPVLQRLVAAVDELDSADAGTLANADNSNRGIFRSLSNDSFNGPANIAQGDRPGLDLFFGGRTTTTDPPRQSPAAGDQSLSTATSPATQPDLPLNKAGGASETLTLSQALTDLKKLLDSGKFTDPQLRAHLSVVRDARAKTKRAADLAARELLPLLTTDQQAVLAIFSYLR